MAETKPTESKPAPASKPAPRDSADLREIDEGASSDAAYSTYTEVEPDAQVTPAPGRQVEQTRGEATEAAE